MGTLARFVLHHRKLVMLGWAVLFLVGVFSASKVTDRLVVDFSLPGQQGYETDQKMIKDVGTGSDQPYVAMVTLPAGQKVTDHAAEITPVFEQIQSDVEGVRVADFANTDDDTFVTEDGRTTYALVYEPPITSFSQTTIDKGIEPILKAAAADTGWDWKLTGYPQLASGNSDDSGPGVLAETLLGAVGALAVLAFVFASFLALIPLLIAAVSILVTFAVVLVMTYVGDVSFIVQFLIALIGLGVAVDYSLLVVTRWREERAHGADNETAVITAVETAGHAVVSSAGTVAISLLALLAVPVPFLRSMGIGGMVIPVVSAAVVCTLLPALLGGIGPRIDWPRIRHESSASRAWTAWARFIVKRRWPAAIAALVILAALIAPLAGVKIGQAKTGSLAKGGEAYVGLHTLRDGGIPAGVVSPLDVLIHGSDPAGQVQDVIAKAEAVPGIATAFSPSTPGWQTDTAAVVTVIPDRETADTDDAHIVNRVKDAVDDTPGLVGITGIGATVLDYNSAVYGNFPLVIAIIAIVTFLLLVRAFRSILLPLKAVVLNLVSVAATFGATVLFWQHGWGSDPVFGIQSTGAITFWVPPLIFGFLFGLSMDYEVFILARMREEYDKSGSTDEAVIEGLGRTGRLVTCAALILFLAFVALTSGPQTDIKVFASALGIGILLDATIVRALLVPALVALFGKWNWWLPTWMARPMRIPAHAAVPEQRLDLTHRPDRNATRDHVAITKDEDSEPVQR
jgi:RND superfamily putative drug exporter